VATCYVVWHGDAIPQQAAYYQRPWAMELERHIKHQSVGTCTAWQHYTDVVGQAEHSQAVHNRTWPPLPPFLEQLRVVHVERDRQAWQATRLPLSIEEHSCTVGSSVEYMAVPSCSSTFYCILPSRLTSSGVRRFGQRCHTSEESCQTFAPLIELGARSVRIDRAQAHSR
jgi:hypothetical protein